ncbi:hypothetical protein I6N90_01345 [Paenibacillus sp. GSMTC-2017]|uniref:hypothetical protein n=1 Tax=Paenibacillus sp. GSMTC-2017 TaxID=2794350 RepID=UPI0018D6DBA1|nr:hypothetical protein [Paenibacillus sp. GSMTC-2017]MBH5316449.1 hypothetical protein [Paenibacillus sp. GSMTC-2017]
MSNVEETNTRIIKFITTLSTLFIIAILLIPAFIEPEFSFRSFRFRFGIVDISIGLLAVLVISMVSGFAQDMDRRYLVITWMLIIPIIAIQVMSGQTYQVFDEKLFALILASIAAVIGIVGLYYIRGKLMKTKQTAEWKNYVKISKLIIVLIPSAYFVLYIFIAVIEETLLFDYQMLYPILLWFLLLNSGLMLLSFSEKKQQGN